MMKRLSSPLLALATGSAVLLGSHPALAHGTAASGALGGVTHPLLGLDHLIMLMAAGSAASLISWQLLLWALGGACIGAVIGGTGISLASAEVLAALAISAVALMTLLAGTVAKSVTLHALTSLSGLVVAAGISVHALLHGLEAPQDSSSLSWWGGALLSSLLICGSSYLLFNKVPQAFTTAAAAAFLVIGAVLACAPLVAGVGA
jgi:urease accessory protein